MTDNFRFLVIVSEKISYIYTHRRKLLLSRLKKIPYRKAYNMY